MAKSAVGVSKETGDVRKVTEAAADLKEARDHVHTVLDAKWPKAANTLSARLKSLGPQLKDAGDLDQVAGPPWRREGTWKSPTYMFPPHI